MSTRTSTMVEAIKPFIPSEIVMTAKAYSDPKAKERTILNIWDKVKKDYIAKFPRFANFDFSDYELDVMEIIHCRILIS